MTGNEAAKQIMFCVKPMDVERVSVMRGEAADAVEVAIDTLPIAVTTVGRNLQGGEPSFNPVWIRRSIRNLAQLMPEQFSHVAWNVQVQLILNPVAECPLSTDAIQAYAKLCPGLFQQNSPCRLRKILSESFRGPHLIDLPGEMGRVERLDPVEQMYAKHIL
jgi:hypothetical protein